MLIGPHVGMRARRCARERDNEHGKLAALTANATSRRECSNVKLTST